MKANELREMQTAELTSKLADLKAEPLKQQAPRPRPDREPFAVYEIGEWQN